MYEILSNYSLLNLLSPITPVRDSREDIDGNPGDR